MNLGMILVLFILLVAVTRIFIPNNCSDDNSIEVRGSQEFQIINNSRFYLFISIYSGSLESEIPSSIPANGGQNLFYLHVDTWRPTSASIGYYSLSSDRFSVTLNYDTNYRPKAFFTNYSSSSSITWKVLTNTKLEVLDAVL
ncbi:hypothetical protein M3223_06380 [Paenibacillus pasadenensis]|uniref:hypothetical protein n=1 Tax=Paenibacillus pasadenensis TaxID=217090 RepID=UPI00203BF17A|nr:hypothetical protein [Paenibacillus pasadenensis]MCM3746979.1 hypothetical protein [Paenibacillus pasadenensis]